MPENKPFVINDRRKFTSEGEPRPDAPPSEPKAPPPTPEPAPLPQAGTTNEASAPGGAGPTNASLFSAEPQATASSNEALPETTGQDPEDGFEAEGAEGGAPPPPTPEEIAQVSRAYEATVDRLDTALRASNPGGERLPTMNFERLVQSLYMQSFMQLGGAAERGQQPQVDLIGARQTIDMLAVIADKAAGNLSPTEDNFLQSALFELRMGFLELTQMLARQAASRQPGTNPLAPGSPGPSIVR